MALQATFSAASGKDLGASEEIKESKTVIRPKGIDSGAS